MQTNKYEEFIQSKYQEYKSSGFDADIRTFNENMFDWQKAITKWALKKGKCAIFADCGLGKTLLSLEWAKQVNINTNKPVLILAPLAVSTQTVHEGEKFGFVVNLCKMQADVINGINITNYEKIEHFNANEFSGIVLDESSILKHSGSKTRAYLTDIFRFTQYKLCCTATPSPNDFMELGNHTEFLNIMSQTEMLATYFIHDGGDTQKWRLKGHAEKKFFKFISSWAACIQNPADLGYNGEKYILPSLTLFEHIIESEIKQNAEGQFMLISETNLKLSDRQRARRVTISDRATRAAEIANNTDEQFLIWCDLNDESAELSQLINDSVEVRGSHSNEYKEKAITDFVNGKIKVLISKPSICGFGINAQNCHNIIFVGLSDSFEMYYQAVRRCWRFGQEKPVDVHIVISENEGAVKINIERKQKNAMQMTKEIIQYTKDNLISDLKNTSKITESYNPTEKIIFPAWLESLKSY